MILIDAVFVHDGGGKVLLDYLVKSLKTHSDKEVTFLLDYRVVTKMPAVGSSEVFFASGFYDRSSFYHKHAGYFSKIFCFGNIPPNIKTKSTVIVYLHSSLYLTDTVKLSVSKTFLMWVKKRMFFGLRKNTDLWVVQTEMMRELLQRKICNKKGGIKVIPFYSSIIPQTVENFRECKKIERNSFLYASLPTSHKNHQRLIEAFCIFYDKYAIGKLTLTVNQSNPEIYNLIMERIVMGYPIVNLGVISREEIFEEYKKTEFLFYPSLRESFGLPLIEASEMGCKIIAADLPYVKDVCIPSLVFNPEDVSDMASAFATAVEGNLAVAKPLVTDEIEELLQLILKTRK